MIETITKICYKCECEVCGHKWESRGSNLPRICPKCRSGVWNGHKCPLRYCFRCGYKWYGGLDKLPQRCPRCHSLRWNLEVLPKRVHPIRSQTIRQVVNLSKGQRLLQAIFGEYFNETNDRDISPQIILDTLDGCLGERERIVLELRFGLNDGRCRTLGEIGERFCVTRERIRQIQEKSLRKLRSSGNSHLLRPLVK